MDLRVAAAICKGNVLNIGRVIRGKEDAIHQALACWLGGGHLLIEYVPGTGKTKPFEQ